MKKDNNGSYAPAASCNPGRAKTGTGDASVISSSSSISTSNHQYEAQLSERDSIFATSYAHDEDPGVNVTATPDRELKLRPCSPSTFTSTTSSPQEEGATRRIDIPSLTRPSSMSGPAAEGEGDTAVAMPVAPPARSLDNPAIHFGSYVSSLAQERRPHHNQNAPRTPISRHMKTHSRPSSAKSRANSHSSGSSTPNFSIADSRHFDELQSSAERQSYRSWREGKAKMQGKTIAQSQRMQTDAEDVDRKIDAKIKPEPAQNVRSRKTSHYLGLFQENEQEVKKVEEKTKDKLPELDSVAESRDDSVIGMYISPFLTALKN